MAASHHCVLLLCTARVLHRERSTGLTSAFLQLVRAASPGEQLLSLHVSAHACQPHGSHSLRNSWKVLVPPAGKLLVLPAGSPCCALQAIGISSKFSMMCACVVSYGPLMETFQRACAGGAKPQSPLASLMLSLFSAGCQD